MGLQKNYLTYFNKGHQMPQSNLVSLAFFAHDMELTLPSEQASVVLSFRKVSPLTIA